MFTERERKHGSAPLRLWISCPGSGVNARSDLRCTCVSKGGLRRQSSAWYIQQSCLQHRFDIFRKVSMYISPAPNMLWNVLKTQWCLAMIKTQPSLASSYQLGSSRSVPFPLLICLLLAEYTRPLLFWGCFLGSLTHAWWCQVRSKGSLRNRWLSGTSSPKCSMLKTHLQITEYPAASEESSYLWYCTGIVKWQSLP